LLECLSPAGTEVLLVTRDHLSLRPGLVWVDVEEVMRATTDQPASLSLLDGDLLEDLDGIDPTFDAWLTTERERLRDRARAVAEALLREQVEPETTIPAAQRLLQIDRAHEGAFHIFGVARNMGGWRNWSQNVLNGPPIPAPPSFTGLALAGLAALALLEDRSDA
jgi:hypothetical protein